MEAAKRGKPSLLVCSTAFAELARAQARSLGYPGLPIIVVEHPFGSKSREEIRHIAASCANEIGKLLEAAS